MTKTAHPQQTATTSKQKKERNMKESSTWFFVTAYITDEMVKEFAEKEYDRIRYMSAMYHDKDVYTEKDEEKDPKHKAGTSKKPHFHVVINTTTNVSLSAMQSRWDACMFQDEKGDLLCYCETTHNAQRAEDYQEHKHNPEKHQYPSENRVILVGEHSAVENSRPKDKAPQEPKKDNTFEILEQLAQGVSKWTLAKKYGRDYILNANKYDYLLAQLNPVEMRQAYHGMTESDAVAGAIESAKEEAKQWREWNDTNTQIFESDARAREEARNEEKYNYKPTLDDWR